MPSAPGAPLIAAIDLRPGDSCQATTADGVGHVFARCAGRWIVLGAAGELQTKVDAAYGMFWPAPDGLLGWSSNNQSLIPYEEVVHIAADGSVSYGAAPLARAHPA